jgi:hypothetical protein
VTLYHYCSNYDDTLKNMAARGRGWFSLYALYENFKKSYFQKPEARFE